MEALFYSVLKEPLKIFCLFVLELPDIETNIKSPIQYCL